MGKGQAAGNVYCSPKSAASFIAGVVMGTVNTLVMKVMYETESIGVNGRPDHFEKPIFLAFIMFAGMLFSLPGYFLYQLSLPKKDRSPAIPFRVYCLLAIPSCFDLFGSVLAQFGLLYVTPSLFMLVRCFVIIVTAILKVTVLKNRLARHMWLGVIINFAAMCLVSAPSFLTPAASLNGRDPRLGILFILLSCLVQGSQYVFEEKVMAVDGVPALVVVGMEGFWGVILSLAFCWPVFYLLPGSDKGSMENMWDAVVMLHHSSLLTGYLLLFLFSVALYNVFAVLITSLLNSIWHAILDNFRPIAVWGTDLVIYYVISNGAHGENWVYPGSYLQFFGMITLFFGTAVYNGSIPALYWKDDHDHEVEEAAAKKGLIHTPLGMASPSLTRSPWLHKRPPPQQQPSHPMTNYGSTNN